MPGDFGGFAGIQRGDLNSFNQSVINAMLRNAEKITGSEVHVEKEWKLPMGITLPGLGIFNRLGYDSQNRRYVVLSETEVIALNPLSGDVLGAMGRRQDMRKIIMLLSFSRFLNELPDLLTGKVHADIITGLQAMLASPLTTLNTTMEFAIFALSLALERNLPLGAAMRSGFARTLKEVSAALGETLPITNVLTLDLKTYTGTEDKYEILRGFAAEAGEVKVGESVRTVVMVTGLSEEEAKQKGIDTKNIAFKKDIGDAVNYAQKEYVDFSLNAYTWNISEYSQFKDIISISIVNLQGTTDIKSMMSAISNGIDLQTRAVETYAQQQ